MHLRLGGLGFVIAILHFFYWLQKITLSETHMIRPYNIQSAASLGWFHLAISMAANIHVNFFLPSHNLIAGLFFYSCIGTFLIQN